MDQHPINSQSHMAARIVSTFLMFSTAGAFAAPILFSNRAAFESAITAGNLNVESFETAFVSIPEVDFGGFSASVSGRSFGVRHNDETSTDGSWSIDADPSVTFNFYSPVNAFGIDIIDFGTDFDFARMLFTGFGLTDYEIATSVGFNTRYQSFFFGIIDPSNTWTKATLTNTDTGDSMMYDRLAYGNVTINDVPEPNALGLLGLGLIGLLFTRSFVSRKRW